jgi:hypothetical protein
MFILPDEPSGTFSKLNLALVRRRHKFLVQKHVFGIVEGGDDEGAGVDEHAGKHGHGAANVDNMIHDEMRKTHRADFDQVATLRTLQRQLRQTNHEMRVLKPALEESLTLERLNPLTNISESLATGAPLGLLYVQVSQLDWCELSLTYTEPTPRSTGSKRSHYAKTADMSVRVRLVMVAPTDLSANPYDGDGEGDGDGPGDDDGAADAAGSGGEGGRVGLGGDGGDDGDDGLARPRNTTGVADVEAPLFEATASPRTRLVQPRSAIARFGQFDGITPFAPVSHLAIMRLIIDITTK